MFESIPIGKDEAALVEGFLSSHDFASESRRALVTDLKKFARWFADANREPFVVGRVTVRDVSDCRDYLRREKKQAVGTVNRCLGSVRRFFGWLADEGRIPFNPAKPVKELRKQQLAPKGLDRSQVRQLLREIELRHDVRAGAIFSLFLYSGCRVGDLANLELHDLILGEHNGSVAFRYGKGGKQRNVPLPLPARRALQVYLDTRPATKSSRVFVGERGPLTERGVRKLCDKYSAITGTRIHPHLLRHTMAHKFLDDNPGDLVSLAQILGHENLNTTARYTKRTQQQLSDAADKLNY